MMTEETRSLLNECEIDFISEVGEMGKRCEVCYRGGDLIDGSLLRYRITPESLEDFELIVCETCAKEWRGEEQLERERNLKIEDIFGKKVSSLSEEFTKRPDEDEFFADHPDWMRYLNEFQSGHFTLRDGTQDEMLESIANQWDIRTFVTDKQMRAFIGRCSYYCQEKMKGNELTTPESKHRGPDIVDPLIKKVDEMGISLFGDSEWNKITSLKKWYDKRGYLTIAQVELLVRVLKKAEQRI